jgi:hypothetical protein
MRSNQPVRYGLVVEYTTKVRDDHPKRLTDPVVVELECEIDLLEPCSANSQEVRALYHLLAVDGYTARNLSSGEEVADQHRSWHNPVSALRHAVAARLRTNSAVACPISSGVTSPVFHVTSYSPGSATSTSNLSMIIL